MAVEEQPTEKQPSSQHSHAAIKTTYRLQCTRKNHLDIAQGDAIPSHLAIYDRGQDKPDLVLHRGASPRSPQLAMSKIERSSRNFSIYLGAEENPAKETWEVVRFITGGSRLPGLFPFNASHDGDPQRGFHWTKTRERDLGASSWSGRDFKLVDVGTGEVVAVYIDRMGMHAIGRRGRLEWMRECDEAFEAQALIILFSILERKSRSVRAVFKAISPGGSSAGVAAG